MASAPVPRKHRFSPHPNCPVCTLPLKRVAMCCGGCGKEDHSMCWTCFQKAHNTNWVCEACKITPHDSFLLALCNNKKSV